MGVRRLEGEERVKEMTRSRSELEFVPYEKVYGQGIEDVLHRVPAIEKISAAIGWEPQLNLDVILADVIKHARTAPVALPDTEALEAVQP